MIPAVDIPSKFRLAIIIGGVMLAVLMVVFWLSAWGPLFSTPYKIGLDENKLLTRDFNALPGAQSLADDLRVYSSLDGRRVIFMLASGEYSTAPKEHFGFSFFLEKDNGRWAVFTSGEEKDNPYSPAVAENLLAIASLAAAVEARAKAEKAAEQRALECKRNAQKTWQ